MDLYTKRSTCRLCKHEDLSLAFHMEPIPRGDGYTHTPQEQPLLPLDIMFCDSCGHVQISHDVDQTYIYENYLWKTAISPGLVASYKDYVDDWISRYSPRVRGKTLEIGSNDGSFSQHLKERGFEVLGIDPAKVISQLANDNGIPTITGFFNPTTAHEICEEHGAMDFIFANHMFANINDVQGIVDGVKDVLAPGGIFTIQVFYLYDVIKDKLLENFNHEHPSYFYVKTLKKYFESQGFEMIGAQRIATKGGSIRCAFQRTPPKHVMRGSKGVRHIYSEEITTLITKEEVLGLGHIETYNQMDTHIKEIREQFKEFFKMCRLENRKVAGYGTSIGATVFDYQYGLGSNLEFLVDDDPIREGLLTPGHGLQVKNPKALYDENIDIVLILAPLYADKIIAKHKEFVEKGGRFMCFRPHDKLVFVAI